MLLVKNGWAALRIIIFLLSLLPFLLLVNDAVNDRLGANPIETLHFGFGDWALRFLCITLALSPIKTITGLYQPIRYKRMMGLFAFFMPVCIYWFLSSLICHYLGKHSRTRCRKVLIS